MIPSSEQALTEERLTALRTAPERAGNIWEALFIKVRLPTASSEQMSYNMGKWTYNVKGIDMQYPEDGYVVSRT